MKKFVPAMFAMLAIVMFGPLPHANAGVIRVHQALEGEALASPSDEPTRTKVFNAAGLKLTASCSDIAGLEAEVLAVAKRDHGTLHANHQSPTGHGYVEDDDWSAGDPPLPVAAVGPGQASQLGQIVYVGGKSVVAVDLLVGEQYNAFAGDHDCLIAGTARVLDSGPDRIRARMDAGTGPKLVFDRGGLSVRAECTPDGQLEVMARSSTSAAALQLNSQSGQNEAADPTHAAYQLESMPDEVTLTPGPEFADNAVGQLIYARPKVVVSIDWLAEEDVNSVGGTKDCAFAGIARVAGADSQRRVFNRTVAPAALARRARGGGPVNESFPVFSLGGMEFRGTCEWTQGVPGTTHVNLYPSSTTDDATLYANSQSDVGEDAAPETGFAFDNDFDDLGDLPLRSAFGEDDELSGQLIFVNPDGRVLSMDFLADRDELFDRRCTFAATAELK